MIDAEIRGSGHSFAVFVDGQQVGTHTNAYEKACIKARKIERDLQRIVRACMCCSLSFTAEHRHNYLCSGCTDFASGAMV